MSNEQQSGQEQGQSFSSVMREFVAMGFRHKSLMKTAFLWTLLGSLLAVFYFGITFESDMQILARHDITEPGVTPDASARAQLPSDNDATTMELNSESQLLLSDDLLRKVVDQCPVLVWGTPHWYTPFVRKITGMIPGYDDLRVPKAVQALSGGITATPVKDSSMIQVSYSSSTPSQSSCVVNALTLGYMAKHLAVNRPPKLYDFFAEQTETYRKRLQDSEQRLLDFARKQDAVLAATREGDSVAEANTFLASLRTTEAQIEQTQARMAELQHLQGSTTPRITTQLKDSDNSQLMATLKGTLANLQQQRAALLMKYDPAYRLVQEVDAQIKETETAIAAQDKAPVRESTTDQNPTYQWVNSALAQAKADLPSLQAQASAIRGKIAQYNEEALAFDSKSVQENDLMREVKAEESNYLLYLPKREQARIQDMLDTRRVLNVAIAEAPTMPTLPLYSVWLLIGLAFLLAAFVSAGAALIADYVDPSFRTPDEVKKFLDIPVFASIPENGHEFHEVQVGSGTSNDN
jgi:uncharacterized protein involved in exopolysaccharide biosynthesis